MSRIVQYFQDKLKTIKEYPITLTKAIYDENGNRLDNTLNNIVYVADSAEAINLPVVEDSVIIDLKSYCTIREDSAPANTIINNIILRKSGNVCELDIQISSPNSFSSGETNPIFDIEYNDFTSQIFKRRLHCIGYCHTNEAEPARMIRMHNSVFSLYVRYRNCNNAKTLHEYLPPCFRAP